jgi:aerobic-type carbon monoxide dehydrogenase small subunit (CoxS/CutS family)
MFAVQAAGKRIRTVEGLMRDGKLHPLQRAFVAHHGLQCGFCTPGFLMLAVNMLEQNPNVGEEEMLDVLASNLCRCTGYHNIVAAVLAAQAEMRPKDQAKPPVAPPAVADTPDAVSAAAPELLEQAEIAHEQ